MPPITIDVSPDQRDDVLRELLSLYGVKAEAIHHAIDRYLTDEEPLNTLLRHRAESAAVEALLDQLGWQLNRSPAPARLTGEPHLLAEASRAALAGAVENLYTTLSDTRSQGQEMDMIVHALRRIIGLFALLAAAYRTPLGSAR